MFFSGFLAVSTAVIIFSVYIVKETNGDKNGIAICFGGFIFSVILLIIVSYRFNRTAVEQLKSKGKIRSFLQRLQTNAECIAFFASSRFCELVSYLKLNDLVHKWNVQAALWYAAVNIPLILMGMSMCMRIFEYFLSLCSLFRLIGWFYNVYFTSDSFFLSS